ncbi:MULTISPECIES: O-antigen ligase [unclassified Frigoribacterium]|uniref:O-antigen ligase family protein n=1 Tax=unclassified Frigoribacterium TaxID=2627005 RepID=UPI0015674F07|nr:MULTISPECIES: O-antigen ligase family protein [unclassified Frigoribacterium]NQW86488.1 O-antigen ligase family protein [Frigoribacterium sp. VKM Ac-2860]NQX07820.1 O-antigen ligase family protein [Frigoribacterium sp. VKM Ac-2859]
MTTTLPARPARTAPTRGATTFATLAFLVLFGGDVLRNGTGWWGWGAACMAMVVAAVVLVVRHPPRVRTLPRLLVLFLLFAVVSIAWSQYPAGSAIGIVLTLMTSVGALAVTVVASWPTIVTALGRALRIHVVASLLFEVVVGLVVRQPVCPVYLDCTDRPAAWFWSRDVLFEGGRIQGLQGNSNILAIIALLALIVTAVQAADRSIGRGTAVVGLVTSLLALVLTRSATVAVVAVAVGLVLLLVVATRRREPGRRGPVFGVAALVVLAAVTVVVLARGPLLALLGKSGDLTGRTDIWSAVYDLGVQHPVVGWGWVSYWFPFVEPFTDLAERNGVVYLQAHDAYLDVWFQLGWIGLALFGLTIVGVVLRSWWWAVDRRMLSREVAAPWSALDLLPLLLVTALLVHGLTESRLIVEWGWATFVVVVLVTRRDPFGWTGHDR